MKRLFAMLLLASTLAIPVTAQEIADTASGAPDSTAEFRIETAEEVAFAPEYSPEGMNMAIGIASASGPAKLSLSDEQLEKIAKLRADLSDSSAGKKAQLHVLHRQLKDSLTKESVDKSAVMDLQSKINNLKSELSNAKLSTRLEALAVLTPEQKAKLRHAALQRQIMGGKHGMGGRQHGHGGKGGRHHGGGHGRGPGSCSVPPEASSDDKAMGPDNNLPPV